MSNKKITQLPAKTTQINSNDLFELAEVQPGGSFISKKISGSQLIAALPIGPQGPQGPVGPIGPVGPQGATGATGPQGPAGTNSVSGLNYEGVWDAHVIYTTNSFVSYNNQLWFCISNIGPVSPTQNPSVDTSHWILLSIQGAQGPIGPAGTAGATGATGATGAAGPQGPQGDIGPQGIQGIQGIQGLTGPAGPAGPQGPVGPTAAGSFTHWIGEKFQGGTIAALWKNSLGVEHGLILCENNVTWANGSQIPFRSVGSSIIINGENSYVDGQSNTTSIISSLGIPATASDYYAAYACDQLVYGGYSDWYLPSVYEMAQIKQNALAINMAIIGLGSGQIIHPQYPYWTSSVDGVNMPIAIGGTFTTYGEYSFDTWINVRAIRKF